MKKLLIINPPFCTPASPSYSITSLYAYLNQNCPDSKIKALDLNLILHEKQYKEFQKYSRTFLKRYDPKEYEEKAKEFTDKAKEDLAESNRNIIQDKDPLPFNELIKEITKEKPDSVAFSMVYSSQTPYTYSLIRELKKTGIKTIVGGPATSKKLAQTADLYLNDPKILAKELDSSTKKEENTVPDFGIWEKEYFAPEIVHAIKTANTCYYQKCAYCTRFIKEPYKEYPIEQIKEAISKMPEGAPVMIIDDMISKSMLMKISDPLKEKKATYACQLKPTIEYDKKTLDTLSASGLKMVIWGVESGSERILRMINKGTNTRDIRTVLENSHKARIRNVCYALFGFPTETKEELLCTLKFMEDNKENIDLLTTSVFGLHKNIPIHENPEKYGIKSIKSYKRHFLDERLEHEPTTGLTKEKAKKLRYVNMKRIESVNKYPRTMNYFREHMLCLVKEETKK